MIPESHGPHLVSEMLPERQINYTMFIKINWLRLVNEYKLYRNTLKRSLKAAEKIHCDLILQNKGDSTKTWSIIKTTINKNKKMKSEEQLKLNNSTITTDKQTISNKFNDFSINVGPTLSRKIPKQDVLPEHYMKSNSLNSLYIELLYEQEVFKLISSLKSSTAGYGNISATLLELCSSSKTPPLTIICNLSLQEGVFPDERKIANVIPLLKMKAPNV